MGERSGGGEGRSGRKSAWRAKDPEKRRAILEAAEALFRRDGFAATSMDAVAAAAGVSKRTVYNHFADKRTLFEAILAEGERLPALAGVVADADDLRERLRAVGTALLTMLSDPEIHRHGRLLMLDAQKNPDLVERFYRSGPGAMLRDLAGLIEQAAGAGRLAVPDPMLAADQLLSMWQGMHNFRQQLGLAEPRTPAEIEAHVEACLAMFLRAYAPPGASPA